MKTQLTICIVNLLIGLFATARTEAKPFFGTRANRLVLVQLNDTSALVEYYTVSHSCKYCCRFDTLRFARGKYSGKHSEIDNKNDKMIFKPGNIVLKPGFPDTSFNRLRNLGYLHYWDSKLKIKFGWTNFPLNELSDNGRSQKSFQSPAIFQRDIRTAYDSLCNYYGSAKATQWFNRVVIRNGKIFPKICFNSADSVEIYRIWKLLAAGNPKKNSMFPYLVQYPISVVPIAMINLDVAVLCTPVTYPSLIGIERMLINRVNAKTRYTVVFQSRVPKMRACSIKICHNKIVTEAYNYQLPFSLGDSILQAKTR